MKILVPLDGSRFAEAALPVALGYALRTPGELEIVTVAEAAPPFAVPQYDALIHKWAEDYQADVKARIARRGPHATGTILIGSPAQRLREHVETTGPDLVVMASHGRGPLSRAWIGSIADAMVRHSPRPVLLVRPEEDVSRTLDPTDAPRNILVPLDGSELAESVLDRIELLPAAEDPTYTLLRVVRYPYAVVSPYLPDTMSDNRELSNRAVAGARDYLTELSWRLAAKGLKCRTEVQIADHPAQEIVGYAHSNEIDLIALVTHGRGGLKRFALGSVTDKVLRISDVPVLVFHPVTSTARTAV